MDMPQATCAKRKAKKGPKMYLVRHARHLAPPSEGRDRCDKAHPPSRLTHIGAVIWNEAAFGAGVSRSLSCLISGCWTQIGRGEDSVVEKKSSVHQGHGLAGNGVFCGFDGSLRRAWQTFRRAEALQISVGKTRSLLFGARACGQEDQRTRMDTLYVEHIGRRPLRAMACFGFACRQCAEEVWMLGPLESDGGMSNSRCPFGTLGTLALLSSASYVRSGT